MMMMINRQHPTVEIPPWDPPYDDPTAGMGVFSPQTNAYFSALHRFLPSCETELDDSYSDTESCGGGSDLPPHDSFSCDNFRMYEFKVRRCARGRSHDWTECPYAHPGEKARRRDPRKYHYSGAACPDFRRGCCRKGDACEFAHGVFECWLHPARYRTQPCKDGPHCQRRVCFFAHTADQLRVLPESPPSRLGQLGLDSVRNLGISPASVMELPDSPPMSPSYGDSVSELVNSVRGLQIGMSPRSPGGWGVQMGGCGSGFGSPRSPTGLMGGYCGTGSAASPLTRTPTRSGLGSLSYDPDPWEAAGTEEEMLMERVESGKNVRAQMYAKLSEENSLERDRVETASPGPDFGWVSELVK
ncbi:hypothetical protein RND81_03G146000 [Saponaria officinalis]|uniref:C3H1-type domain-containing protein n=1 Tax=Saponaria officinalis TaxID=3572 RepID=A0AAW1M3U4_SAPOF